MQIKKGVEPCLKTNVAITSIIPDKNVIKNGRLKKKKITQRRLFSNVLRVFSIIYYTFRNVRTPLPPPLPSLCRLENKKHR